MALRTTSSIVAILESWRQHGQSERFEPLNINPFLLENSRDVFFVRVLSPAEKLRLIHRCPDHGLDEVVDWIGAVASDNRTVQAASHDFATLLAELQGIGYVIHEPS